MLRLLAKNRDFRALYLAQLISYCGDWFATVALLGLVGDLTDHSALAAALVFVAQTLPAFLVAPLAGPLADRVERQLVMVVASAAQVVAALGLLLVGAGTVWLAFVAQSLITILAAFFGPASQAALPNLVDPEDLPKAAAAMGATWGAMLAVGASLGAVFAAVFGRDAAFVADAVSFAIAGALIATIRRPTIAPRDARHRRARMRPVADTVEALRYARSDEGVFLLLLSKGGASLAGGVVGLLAVLASGRYGTGDGGIGVLLAARGLGAVLGPVIAGRVAKRDIARLLLACGLGCLVYGAAYAGVAFAPTLALAAVLVLVAHLGSGTQWTLSTYGLQTLTVDEYRGRVFAAELAIFTLTMSVSFLGAGAIEPILGLRATFLVLASVSVAWGVLYVWVTRRVGTTRAIAGT